GLLVLELAQSRGDAVRRRFVAAGHGHHVARFEARSESLARAVLGDERGCAELEVLGLTRGFRAGRRGGRRRASSVRSKTGSERFGGAVLRDEAGRPQLHVLRLARRECRIRRLVGETKTRERKRDRSREQRKEGRLHT